MQPFYHIDALDDAQFDAHTQTLNINTNSSPKLYLIRAITGSVNIRHEFTSTLFTQSTDYLDLAGANAGKPTLEKIKDYISEDLELTDLSSAFSQRAFNIQNIKFFQRLSSEFDNFCYYEQKQSHTTAFVYVYRILETISYAFPLLYTSRTQDFKGTFNLLKEYFSGTDKGELGFFKGFVKSIFGEDPAAESTISFDILGPTEEVQKKFFKAFQKACTSDVWDSDDSDEPRQLSVKFTEFGSFIIQVRNRFFHLFNSRSSNLESDDILDADHFFGLINKKCMYWISVVLFEIFKKDIESFI